MQGQDHVGAIIEQWRRERPDVDTAAMELVGRIQRVSQELRPRLDRVHARFGLSGESFDVLAALRRSGPPYELSPTELYRQLMLSSGAMTNRIDRLESEGLVTRRADSNDRRGVRVRLTAKGRALIDRALVEHVANEERLLTTITPKERAQLSALLRRLLLAWDGE